MKKKIYNAFTLIEILIVIVIIGILAATLIPKLQGAQERARDVTRKKDLRDIANALELYKEDNGLYPTASNDKRTGSYGTNARVLSNDTKNEWIYGLTSYITTLPKDPINKGTDPHTLGKNYVYVYRYVCDTTPGTYCLGRAFYDLGGQLENPKDTDRNEIKIRTYTAKKWALWPRPTFSPYYYSPLIETALNP